MDLLISPDRDDAHHAHKTVAAVARTAGVPWWTWGLWRDLARPTIFSPFGDRRLAELQHVLAAHRGEVDRNDYHDLLRARAISARILGAERVFGFGSERRAEEPYAELLADGGPRARARPRTPLRLSGMATAASPGTDLDLQALDRVQRRVLWLATSIVHHANRVRENRSGVKVGGHQASSASMVSLMTALWFAHLEAPDRVSVKPHASPVLHAINYLLGRLDPKYLTTLREYGGLQSYPSRTKDPDPVDYSTGSVGIGATAPIWGALAHRYVAGHFEVPRGGRQIALLGDAELDEGACWEAIADPMVAQLGEVMWVVDLNRQSLDRVVPDIAAGRLASMFEAAGWHCVMVKYGPRLAAQPALRERIDAMPNEEYQRLLRADAGELRERLEVDAGRARRRRAAGDVPRPRRPRPRRARRRLPPGRRRARPPDRRLRLHDQGLDAADGGPPGQPLARCSTPSSTRSSRRRSAPTRRTRGRRSTTSRPRRRCARRPPGGSSGRSRSSSPIRPPCRTTSGASTRARRPRSRRSGASSSTSCARRPRWPTAS